MENEQIQFYDHRLMYVKDGKKISGWYRKGMKCKVDYVIVSQNAEISISEIRTVCAPVCIIADASNSHRKIEAWKTVCHQLREPFYAVEENGAFILE